MTIKVLGVRVVASVTPALDVIDHRPGCLYVPISSAGELCEEMLVAGRPRRVSLRISAQLQELLPLEQTGHV